MRNHLAIAMANIEAFQDGQLQPTPVRMEAVLQALHEVGRLIGDLRADEPVEMRSNFRTIDVCSLIANEATAMEATARERGVDLAVHRCNTKHPECSTFVGDPGRITQIVTNIMGNAIRYSPPGGQVVVDCRRDDAELVFSVSDEGPGIVPSEVPYIFEGGFRGRAARGKRGSGIGLALVKSLVEQHAGSIDVFSPDGCGATFVVKMPGRVREGHGAECEDCATVPLDP
jgi:signal transduction histidine kinase